MTNDTIQKSDALDYVLENHWDEVKEKVLGEIRNDIEKQIDWAKTRIGNLDPVVNMNTVQNWREDIQKYEEFKEFLK